MSVAQSTASIIRQALGFAGEVDTGNSEYHARCTPWINKLHEDVLSGSSMFDVDVGQPFPWARAENPKTLILKTCYTDGGVTLTNGSDAGTFSSAPSSSLGSFVDRFLKLDSSPDYYKIIAHTAGSASFTLDSVWADDSVSVASFSAIPLIYDLGSNILRLVEPINVYRFGGFDTDYDGKIYGISINELRKNYPLARLYGKLPERFATLYQSETKYKIQFSTYVTEEIKVDLDYVPRPDLLIDSDDSIPLIPGHKSNLLVYGLAHMIALDKRDYEKAGSMAKQAATILRSLLVEQNRTAGYTARNRAQLVPRQDQMSNNKFRGIS
jgi:hypothetical protein